MTPTEYSAALETSAGLAWTVRVMGAAALVMLGVGVVDFIRQLMEADHD